MAKIEAAIAAKRSDTQRHIDRLRQLRGDLGNLVAVEQPDRAAIDAKLAEIRAELSAMESETQATTLDSLLALPPQTRAKLAGPSRSSMADRVSRTISRSLEVRCNTT